MGVVGDGGVSTPIDFSMALAWDGHLDGNDPRFFVNSKVAIFQWLLLAMVIWMEIFFLPIQQGCPSVRTLHYRSDPQGRSWWRFLYSKYSLLFNFKCWLFFQGWDTCEIEINKWITYFLWNYYIWLQFFFNITTTVILTKILSILVSLALLLVISAVLERNKIMRNVKKKKTPNSYIIINLLLGNNPARFRSNLCIFSVAWWSSWLLENFREFAEKHKTRCKFSLLHLNSKQKATHDFHTNFSPTTLVWTFNAMV